jgi:glycosyltransferase involved in cell wall biosynthesis
MPCQRNKQCSAPKIGCRTLRIAFFFENEGLENVRFDEIELGNPGCGGTQYTFMLEAYDLTKAGVDVVVYATSPGIFPSEISVVTGLNFNEALKLSLESDRYLVFRPHMFSNSFINLNSLEFSMAKLIAWLHVTPDVSQIKTLSKHHSIKAYVCLGNNQMTRVLDTGVGRKCVIIPSPLIFQSEQFLKEKRHQQIVFLGALVPQKGFHLLADIWPRISRKFPDARLKVIGSGKLYGDSFHLGSKGIAVEGYEERIFRNLTFDDPTVEFLGVLPPLLKDEVISQSTLGIVNPSGNTETYCGSGIEMQSLGIPVVTARKYGLRDTVISRKTGILIRHKVFLFYAISKLLSNPNYTALLGSNASSWVRKNFTREIATARWIQLLYELETGRAITSYYKVDCLQSLLASLNMKLQRHTRINSISLLELNILLRKPFRPLKRAIHDLKH